MTLLLIAILEKGNVICNLIGNRNCKLYMESTLVYNLNGNGYFTVKLLFSCCVVFFNIILLILLS